MKNLFTRRLTAFTATLFAGVLVLGFWRLAQREASLNASMFSLPSRLKHASCRNLPGAEDVLVVMKTGATEFKDKFPIHLRTTLSCYPNYLVFSDHEEIFEGVQIRDALHTVSSNIRERNADFELYRRLREGGRTILNQGELSGPESKVDSGTGKGDRPGWRLDKWKFLPMLNETYTLSPNMRWYLFVETDTAVFWSTMLKLTTNLNHTDPVYMGAQITIGGIEFAHGGSGFLVSNEAMRLVVDHYGSHQTEWERAVEAHWAGDCVTGKAFKESGAPLVHAWPIIQGDHPGIFPYGENGPHGEPRWCFPTATYHHLTSDIIEELWHYEQKWIAAGGLEREHGSLLFRDVFVDYIMPRMHGAKSQWDSKCTDEQPQAQTLESCLHICQEDSKCLQYKFDNTTLECMTSAVPKLGEVAPGTGFQSGWMYDRIEKWADERPKCKKAPWNLQKT